MRCAAMQDAPPGGKLTRAGDTVRERPRGTRPGRRRGNLPGTSQASGTGRDRRLWSPSQRRGEQQRGRPYQVPLLEAPMDFAARHIGPSAADVDHMLGTLGYTSLDELTTTALPAGLAASSGLAGLPPAATEDEALGILRQLAAANQVLTPMIGLGYYGTFTPAVIRRNVLENPAWYTAYTPYQ